MYIAKMTSKGQVTVPKEIRDQLALKTGSKLLFVEESGRIYLGNASVDELVRAYPESVGVLRKAVKGKTGVKND